MLKKERKINDNVIKNGDTSDKRKHYQRAQSYEYIVSIIFKDDVGSHCFIAFLNYSRLSIECESIFWSKKHIAFSAIRNNMWKGDMEFRPFYLFVRHLVCNLKIPLRNSLVTLFKVLNISITGCPVFY